MTKDDGEWLTDPKHHWLASDLVKCVVSYCSSIVKTEYMRSRISKVKVKRDRAFENSFNTKHINSSSLMPAFYLQYYYPVI